MLNKEEQLIKSMLEIDDIPRHPFRNFIIIALIFSAVLFAINIISNKLNAGVWFCGNGIPMEDPCMGGKAK